ncbi:DNA (cytosine-5-)-methyltransferase [Streptobacillus felis]|uniref:Cytosine-specific methyltransferase n=1 Tax=Streptobacillus felis TaxID=1384509 RepID=A0A7Z0PGP9_9FUSO|nr:DNA (cytosine-5-)-methyltransferase [Streptobacillus felis]NYV27930.1 DNA (cytosine-5-)-methyltransferase [Streptobacillus felis]
MIKIATVFSGIGAIEHALDRMGLEHEIIFACDNGNVVIDYDKDVEIEKIRKMENSKEKRDYVDNLYRSKTKKKNFVKESYLANYKVKDDNFFNDIILLDGRDFKNEVDLFVGGSPCQSFSSVGFQDGLDDTRGTLFYEYARLIEEIHPKVFIYENVRGLYNHDKGKTWEIMQEAFNYLGYDIYQDILNSSDYGIPQTRRRLFVIGFRKDLKIRSFNYPPEKKELKYKMHDFLISSVKEGNFKSKESKLVIKKEKGEVDPKYILSPKLEKYVMSSGTKGFKTSTEIDLPIARTILSTMGNRHRAGVDNYVTDLGEDKIRMLSEREAHRLMGFIDDYKIVVSRAQAYKQAGNSIVVDVFIAIMNEILKTKVIK